MGKITGQLKLFAGKARPPRRSVLVRAAIEHVLALLAPRLASVALHVDGLDALPGVAVRADELKLEQVLLNLVGNALDAIASAAPAHGRIDLSVRADAGTVTIQVRDNGTGIPPEDLPRLFEPFFTTKETGQGLGLGLAISSSIVREFGGQLSAANADGGGAVFTIVLTRAPAEAGAHASQTH